MFMLVINQPERFPCTVLQISAQHFPQVTMLSSVRPPILPALLQLWNIWVGRSFALRTPNTTVCLWIPMVHREYDLALYISCCEILTYSD